MKILALILAFLVLAVAGAMLIEFCVTEQHLFFELSLFLLAMSAAFFGLGYGEYYRERYINSTKVRFNKHQTY